jgi:hypothetical protein
MLSYMSLSFILPLLFGVSCIVLTQRYIPILNPALVLFLFIAIVNANTSLRLAQRHLVFWSPYRRLVTLSSSSFPRFVLSHDPVAVMAGPSSTPTPVSRLKSTVNPNKPTHCPCCNTETASLEASLGNLVPPLPRSQARTFPRNAPRVSVDFPDYENMSIHELREDIAAVYATLPPLQRDLFWFMLKWAVSLVVSDVKRAVGKDLQSVQEFAKDNIRRGGPGVPVITINVNNGTGLQAPPAPWPSPAATSNFKAFNAPSNSVIKTRKTSTRKTPNAMIKTVTTTTKTMLVATAPAPAPVLPARPRKGKGKAKEEIPDDDRIDPAVIVGALEHVCEFIASLEEKRKAELRDSAEVQNRASRDRRAGVGLFNERAGEASDLSGGAVRV